MNIMNAFSFESSEIKRSYDVDCVPWFKAKDVALILEYANTEQAIRVNVYDEDINTI